MFNKNHERIMKNNSLIVACLAKIGVLSKLISIRLNTEASVPRKVSGDKKQNANERRMKEKKDNRYKKFVGTDKAIKSEVDEILVQSLKSYNGTRVSDSVERKDVFMRYVIERLLHFQDDGTIGGPYDIMRYAPRSIRELEKFYENHKPSLKKLYEKKVIQTFYNYSSCRRMKRVRILNERLPYNRITERITRI